MKHVLDFIKKKINHFFILPFDDRIEIQTERKVTMFEDLDPDDDLNVEARDILIDEIIKIMNRDVDIENELEFKEVKIACHHKGGVVALGRIRNANESKITGFEDPVFFTGKKPYPLKIWLKEQVLTNMDVVELEKGLIKMI